MPSKPVDDYDVETEILPYVHGVEGGNGQWNFWCPLHADEGTQWKGFSVTVAGSRNLGKCHSCGATLKDLCDWIENGGYSSNGDAPEEIKVNVRKVKKSTRTREQSDGMAWWVGKTKVPVEVWEEMGCEDHKGGVVFLFEDLPVAKIRKRPKDISWVGTDEYDAPPLWPAPEDELPEHVWITEGESDAGTARATDHYAFGVTKGGKTPLDSSVWEALISRGVREVTLVGDADQSGDEFIASATSGAVSAGLTVNAVHLREIIDPFAGLNDLNGVWRECGTRDQFDALIERCTHRVATKFPYMTSEELEQLLEEDIPWIIPDLVAPGDKVLISGPQKSYKTYLMLDLVRCLVDCKPFLSRVEWTPAQPVPTLVVEEEGSRHAWARRVKRLNLSPDAPVYWMHKQGIRFTESDTIDEVIQMCREEEIQFLILDPMQRMIPGIDENDASAVGIVWDQVMRIQLAVPGIVVLVIHHSNKSASLTWESVRGSGRHAGEADLGIFVQKDKDAENVVRVNMDGRDVVIDLGPDEAFEVKVKISDDEFTLDAREIAINVNPTKAKASRNKEAVLSAIEGGCTTIQSIVSETEIGDVTVRKNVAQLIEENLITETDNGEGRAKTYATT